MKQHKLCSGVPGGNRSFAPRAPDVFSLSWEVQIALKVAEAEGRIALGFTILLVFVHIL